MWNRKEISYEIVELELDEPLRPISVPAERSGLAFVVRRSGGPVGFFMEAIAPGAELSPAEVAERVIKHCGAAILRERIYDELRGPSAVRPLPSLDIAICTHDRAETLVRRLESLVAAGIAPESILVIDNAPSDDRARRAVARFAGVRYLVEPKPGLDFARNRAVRESTADWLAFLDDDIAIDRGWFEGFREAWQTNPDAGCITGPVLPLELNTRAQILFEQIGGFGSNFERVRFGPALAGMPTYPCGAGMFGAGCNMIFSRRVLVELGGFDEALDTGAPLPGGGDLDMFYRVVRGGYPLVREPRLLIFHQHRREYEKLRHQMWTWGLGSMAYVTKAFREDPAFRPRIRRWVLWWFSYQLSKIFAPYLRRDRKPWPWDLAAFEIAGGIVGLFGEYDRSQKRIEALRRKFA